MYRQRYKSSGLQFNMTPLIDCTFLLLTFFMLTSHFASSEKTEMELPKPDHSQAVDRKLKDKVLLNVLYAGPSAPPELRLVAVAVGSLSELGEKLQEAAAATPNIEVILRGDQRVSYGQMRRVMHAISQQKLTNLHVSAELEGPG